MHEPKIFGKLVATGLVSLFILSGLAVMASGSVPSTEGAAGTPATEPSVASGSALFFAYAQNSALSLAKARESALRFDRG
jgi:hypothetical protein